MANKRGRPKKEETELKSARVKINLLDRALTFNPVFSECCNQGLDYFNKIESGEFEIKKKYSS